MCDMCDEAMGGIAGSSRRDALARDALTSQLALQDENARLTRALTAAGLAQAAAEERTIKYRKALELIAAGEYRGMVVPPGGPAAFPAMKRMSRKMMRNVARLAVAEKAVNL